MPDTNNDFITQNSSSYTHEYSNFPYSIIKQHYFKDADDSVASLINEINGYKERGLYDLAAKTINEYKDILKQYSLGGSETINTIEEEIRNGQIMTIQKSQCVFFDNEPEICSVNDVWIGA